jgi:predicted lipoprotein with Yx(FWY)xxD motif
MNQILTLRRFAFGSVLGAIAGAAVLVAAAHGGTSSATRAPQGSLVTLGKDNARLGSLDVRGRTLYVFEKDRKGQSACDTPCVKFWPPLVSRAIPRAGKGVHKAMLGVSRRQDGRRQVTYAGHPLYMLVGDKTPGQTSGEALANFGAEWYALAASGHTVEPYRPSSGGYGSAGGW